MRDPGASAPIHENGEGGPRGRKDRVGSGQTLRAGGTRRAPLVPAPRPASPPSGQPDCGGDPGRAPSGGESPPRASSRVKTASASPSSAGLWLLLPEIGAPRLAFSPALHSPLFDACTLKVAKRPWGNCLNNKPRLECLSLEEPPPPQPGMTPRLDSALPQSHSREGAGLGGMEMLVANALGPDPRRADQTSKLQKYQPCAVERRLLSAEG